MMRPDRFIQNMKEGHSLSLVALGDSLTQGWLVSRGYLDYLGEMLRDAYPSCRVNITNRGIPGNTSEDGLARVGRDVVSLQPDLTFVQFALNDAYTGVSHPEFRENVRSIIRQVQESTDSEIMLLTSVPLMDEAENRHAEKFYGVLKELSLEYNLPLAEVHIHWRRRMNGGLDPADLYQWDGVHPTEEGYRVMAEAIFVLLH